MIFSQERVGRSLKPFCVYKLRTMIKDAEKHTGPVLAEEEDPRITGVGALPAQVPDRRAASALQHPERRDELRGTSA